MMPIYGSVQEGVEKDDPESRGAYPGEAWAMAVTFSADSGRTFPDVSVVASNPAEHRLFNETDILRLRDGRFLAVLREGTPPHWSHKSYSADDGKNLDPPSTSRASALAWSSFDRVRSSVRTGIWNRAVPGMSVSVSDDAGTTWRWVGQLYSGPNGDCAYPVIVRLADDRLFCVYYTSFVDGDCEVRGIWLSDDV